ncbi:MAG TPA: hypothetical protein VLG76_08360 [Rhabdochlamydiaceae bacterium]|nr:hypothetical protein [Rhabdochlamydiaceae bacterium]HSX38654.1 hypothetical protein [Chlamydiales bacterium]
MKRGKVFFHPIEGSAQLSISWSSGPKGDAIEAKDGSGVGFFSREGELLSVIFDEVESSEDYQFLEFAKYRIEVTVRNSKVSYKVHRKIPSKSKLKSSLHKTKNSVLSKRKSSRKAERTKKAR